jgi:hypothetical protein
VGWAPDPGCKLWRREEFVPLRGIEPQSLGRTRRNLAAIPTEQCRLLYYGFRVLKCACVEMELHNDRNMV